VKPPDSLEEVLSIDGRRDAFASLQANPVGSLSDFAKRWGWEKVRVQRFINALRKVGIDVDSGTTNTIVNLDRDPDTIVRHPDTILQSVSGYPDTISESVSGSNPVSLDSGGTSVSGYPDTIVPLDTRSLDLSRAKKYTEKLIEVLNLELSSRFSDFRKKSSDHHGSHRAGVAMLRAGVPLEFAEQQLAQACRRFNPEKHGRGKLPGGVQFFQRGIITDYRRAVAQRAQHELDIRASLRVDRGAVPPPAPPIKEQDVPNPDEKRGGQPVSIQSALDIYLAGSEKREARG
jgi:hypothetical protein